MPSSSAPPSRYNLAPAAVHAAVQHALGQVGLAAFAERPTSSLSGGQKQRVAIAGALAECPRVRGGAGLHPWGALGARGASCRRGLTRTPAASPRRPPGAAAG